MCFRTFLFTRTCALCCVWSNICICVHECINAYTCAMHISVPVSMHIYAHVRVCVHFHVTLPICTCILECNKVSDLQRWPGFSRGCFASLLSAWETESQSRSCTPRVWRGGGSLLCSCSVPCGRSGTCLGVSLGHPCLSLRVWGLCVGSGGTGCTAGWKRFS